MDACGADNRGGRDLRQRYLEDYVREKGQRWQCQPESDTQSAEEAIPTFFGEHHHDAAFLSLRLAIGRDSFRAISSDSHCCFQDRMFYGGRIHRRGLLVDPACAVSSHGQVSEGTKMTPNEGAGANAGSRFGRSLGVSVLHRQLSVVAQLCRSAASGRLSLPRVAPEFFNR